MSNHRVVAAIDFGTHGSGFAWAVVNEINREMTQREIFYFDDWDAQQAVYPKNLSALLLDRSGNLLDWGYRAQERVNLEGLPNGQQYETNYKMSLQQNMGSAGTLQNSGVSNPTADKTAKLIELCIRQVYTKAIEHIKASGVYTEDDIAWCITVPAIWEGYTKDLMLKAAKRAGLPDDEDRLKLALEPEAAALYSIVKGATLLTPGCRFLVIDAGGGTVDITSYEVEPGPRLSQLGTANGDKAGSEYLNKFFVEDVLCDRFGVGFVAEIRKNYPREFYELRGAWERAKRTVTANGTRPLTIPLPAQVYSLATKDGATLQRIQQRQNGIDTAIVIPASEVRQVFEKAVAVIMDAVADHLRQMRSKTRRQNGEIGLLVGGFAESPYLQSRLREYLESEGAVLHIPPRPSLAVMTGAAHFAYDPTVIRVRRSPLTYGQEVAFRFREGIDPEAKRVKDEDGDPYCNNRFDVFVTRDEAIETGECRSSTITPMYSRMSNMLITIYATADTTPVYTDESGAMKLADLTVYFGAAMSVSRDKREVEVRMYFGDTHIHVEAETLHTRQVIKTEIKWKPTW